MKIHHSCNIHPEKNAVNKILHIQKLNPDDKAHLFALMDAFLKFIKRKYIQNQKELDQNIPMLQLLVTKPFEKENELGQLKKDVPKLEREISIKIQENQMRQQNVGDDKIANVKETPSIKLEKSLLQKKAIAEKKVKSLRI